MRAVILAAGLGSRLKALTKNKPKCLVEYKQKPILAYLLDSFKKAGIKEIAVVGGYKIEVLEQFLKERKAEVKLIYNDKFKSTNMLYSLFCARDFWLGKESIISYGDIIYDEACLGALKACEADFAIMLDKNWLELWQKRFSDVLSDAEALKIQNGLVKMLGKKAKTISDVQAGYMGLFKISASFSLKLSKLYDSLDRSKAYDGKDFLNMYMTSFLNELIERFDNARAVFTPTPWLEIDEKSDLDIDIWG